VVVRVILFLSKSEFRYFPFTGLIFSLFPSLKFQCRFLYLARHLSRNIFVYEQHRFPLLLLRAVLFLGVSDRRFPAVDISLVYRSVRLVRKLTLAKETTALSYLVSCLMYPINHSVLLSGCWITKQGSRKNVSSPLVL